LNCSKTINSFDDRIIWCWPELKAEYKCHISSKVSPSVSKYEWSAVMLTQTSITFKENVIRLKDTVCSWNDAQLSITKSYNIWLLSIPKSNRRFLHRVKNNNFIYRTNIHKEDLRIRFWLKEHPYIFVKKLSFLHF
jgi:hypothetical protein